MKNGHYHTHALPHFFNQLLSRCHWRFVLHSQNHSQVMQNYVSHTISTEGFLLHSSNLFCFVFLTYFSCFRHLAALWHVFYPTRIIFCITLTSARVTKLQPLIVGMCYEINLSNRRNQNIFISKCDAALLHIILFSVHSLQNL